MSGFERWTDYFVVAWYLATASDAVAALFLVWRIWSVRLDSKYTLRLIIALVAFAMESVVAFVTIMILPAPPMRFIVARMITRTIKAAGMWQFALYLIRYGRSKDQPAIRPVPRNEMTAERLDDGVREVLD